MTLPSMSLWAGTSDVQPLKVEPWTESAKRVVLPLFSKP